jgi:hypothetical protein
MGLNRVVVEALSNHCFLKGHIVVDLEKHLWSL